MPKRCPALTTSPGNFGDDAARDKAGDLDKSDFGAALRFHRDGLAFVVLAGLVQRLFKKEARAIGDLFDRAVNGNAIHMNIEDVHEDGDAGQRSVAQPQFRRGNGCGHHLHHPVGGTDDQAFAGRRNTIRIAEKINTPERQNRSAPAKRLP